MNNKKFTSILLCITLTLGVPMVIFANTPKTKNDSIGWKYYNKADHLIETNLELAEQYLDSTLMILEQEPDEELLHYYLFTQANLFNYKEKHHESISKCNEAINYFIKNGNGEMLGDINYVLGVNYYYLSQFDKAIYKLSNAANIYDSLNIKEKYIDTQNTLGSCFYYLKDYSTAEKYYIKVKEHAEQTNDTVLWYISLNNLASINNAPPTIILTYYKQAVFLCKQLGQTKELAELYINIGLTYKDLNKIDSTSHYFNKAKIANSKHKKQGVDSWIYSSIGSMYLHISQLDSALLNTNKAIKLSKKQNNILDLQEVYLQKSLILKKQRKLEQAYEFLTLSSNLKDSIWNENTVLRISELENYYDSEQKAKDLMIKQEKIDSQNSEIKSSKARIIFLTTMGILLLVIIISSYFYSRRIKQVNKKLKTKNETINSKNIALREIIIQRDKLISIIAHDIKNPLNAIMGFSQLAQNIDIYTETQQLDKYLNLIHKSSVNLNDLLNNLLGWAIAQKNGITIKPEKLSIEKLIKDNLEICEQTAKQKNLSIINKCQHAQYIWADSNTINTVIRNILNNATKFTSTNGIVEIRTEEVNNKLHLYIKDNGIGIRESDFPVLFESKNSDNRIGKHPEKGTGLGLVLCKEFMQLNDAEITANSIFGKGTEFKLVFPTSK